MKIAIATASYEPARGGAERYTANLIADLAAAGDEVHVFCARAPYAADIPQGVQVRALGVNARGGRGAWRFAVASWHAIVNEEFQIVHSVGRTLYHNVYQPHGGTAPATLRANLALEHGLARTSKHIFGDLLSIRWQVYKGIEKRAVNQKRAAMPMVIALSNMVRADFERDYGVPADHIRVVYNGVDAERFAPEKIRSMREHTRKKELKVEGDVPVLLMVAHNFKLKGVDLAIGALAELTRRGSSAVLAICGRGRRRPFERQAERLRVADRIRWVGDTQTVQDYYGAADVFVHPTAYDPCSLVMLEAMAAGLPAITTTMNGAGELITRGVDGFVLADATHETLAECCRPLVDDPALRQRIGAAARALAVERSRARNLREMREVFAETIERGIRPGPPW